MKKYSVLIVDDDVAFLNESKQALSAKGYSVLTAGTGRDAKIAAKRHYPDVILLDKKLPDADGQELIKSLKKISKNASIIIVTAYGDIDLAITGIQEGVVDYITKPADPKDILSHIETVLKNKEKSHSV